MDNQAYNSLAQQLIQNGILKPDDSDNLFGIVPDYDMSHSPFVEPYQKKEEIKKQTPKKRINQYDLELMKSVDKPIEGKKNLDKLYLKFFPRLYKARLVKTAMKKLKELNIDTKRLLEKTTPYGENELRYNDLIKYLSFANEIQQDINKN